MTGIGSGTPTLNQALTRRRGTPIATFLLVVGIVGATLLAILGYVELQRTEQIVILIRDVAYGQQIAEQDLSLVAVPANRPPQLRGITDLRQVVGTYASRNLTANDLIQPTMLMGAPVGQPIYPNGEQLQLNMVPFPFAITTLGPVTHQDRVNIGYSDPSGDPDLCRTTHGGEVPPSEHAIERGSGISTGYRPYTCRLLSSVRVLWIDAGVAYLEVTPYQAQALRALQAAGLTLWGERYGASSDPLPVLDRLDAGQLNATGRP
jgi:hypothetical protein